MKTLIAAIIASAVSFGAFAQTSPATSASAPMAKSTASDSTAAKSSTSTKKSTSSKKHHSTKKASAPAA